MSSDRMTVMMLLWLCYFGAVSAVIQTTTSLLQPTLAQVIGMGVSPACSPSCALGVWTQSTGFWSATASGAASGSGCDLSSVNGCGTADRFGMPVRLSGGWMFPASLAAGRSVVGLELCSSVYLNTAPGGGTTSAVQVAFGVRDTASFCSNPVCERRRNVTAVGAGAAEYGCVGSPTHLFALTSPTIATLTSPSFSISVWYHPKNNPSISSVARVFNFTIKVYYDEPTAVPTVMPTASPSKMPSPAPTSSPTSNPSPSPSANPTKNPSASPSRNPSASPSASPTKNPSASPSASPTKNPSASPSQSPSVAPSIASPSTVSPSAAPTIDDSIENDTTINGDVVIPSNLTLINSTLTATGTALIVGSSVVLVLPSLPPGGQVTFLVAQQGITGQFDSVSVDYSGDLASCEQVLVRNPSYSMNSVSVAVTIDRSACSLSAGIIAGIVLGSILVGVVAILLIRYCHTQRQQAYTRKTNQAIKDVQLDDLKKLKGKPKRPPRTH